MYAEYLQIYAEYAKNNMLNMQKIYRICKKYARNMQKYAENMPKICQNVLNTCLHWQKIGKKY